MRTTGTGARPDLRQVLAELGRREMLSVLLESGATLNSAALSAGIVDKMRMFYAPKISGFGSVKTASSGLQAAQQLHDLTIAQFGDDFAIEGYLHDVYRTR